MEIIPTKINSLSLLQQKYKIVMAIVPHKTKLTDITLSDPLHLRKKSSQLKNIVMQIEAVAVSIHMIVVRLY